MKHIAHFFVGIASLAGWAAVDLNMASAEQLEALKGIGPGKARAIVAYRNAHGPFHSVDDLDKVKGIGRSMLDRVRTEVTVRPMVSNSVVLRPSIQASGVRPSSGTANTQRKK